jgi:hypothetical protein
MNINTKTKLSAVNTYLFQFDLIIQFHTAQLKEVMKLEQDAINADDNLDEVTAFNISQKIVHMKNALSCLNDIDKDLKGARWCLTSLVGDASLT